MVVEKIKPTRAHELSYGGGNGGPQGIGAEIFVEGPHELLAEEVAGPVRVIAFAHGTRVSGEAIHGAAHAVHPIGVENAAQADSAVFLEALDILFGNNRLTRPVHRSSLLAGAAPLSAKLFATDAGVIVFDLELKKARTADQYLSFDEILGDRPYLGINFRSAGLAYRFCIAAEGSVGLLNNSLGVIGQSGKYGVVLRRMDIGGE